MITAIREAVESLPLFDTHEHLIDEAQRTAGPVDLLATWLSHYASSDLVSAGMLPAVLEEVRDVSRPLDERWAKIAPFWTHAKTTGYGRALLLAARDLYGVEDVDEHTIHQLAERVNAPNTPGWYRHVLQDRAGIETAVVDPIMGWPEPRPRSTDQPLGDSASRDLLVYVDLSWVHVLSPTFGRRCLREWIETVPSNKILAFGGDYLFVEGVYAHSRMARAGVAGTLSEAVEDEYLSLGEALALARNLLHDNAASFFHRPSRA